MQMFPVIFVSLGPGEPELITVKGLKALQTAELYILSRDTGPKMETEFHAQPTSYCNSTFRKTRCTAFHSP